MMEQRLIDLRKEYERGQQQMTVLENQRRELRDTLLRISGAIQVLEELSAQNGDASHPDDAPEKES